MNIPIIERVKIQTQVLIPLVKALQAELGEERANAIVRRALGDLYRKLGEKWWRVRGSDHLGNGVASAFDEYAAGDALDYEVVKQTPDAFEINVIGCRYAEFYKELGTPRARIPAHVQCRLSHGRGFRSGRKAHAHARQLCKGPVIATFDTRLRRPRTRSIQGDEDRARTTPRQTAL